MGSKTAALHRNNHYADRPVWVTAILLFVWMVSSVASTVTNKTLMTIFPYSATLTLIQITASCVVDYVIILYRRLSIFPLNRALLIQTLPVAASINFSKTLTYVSYGYVPASLTHTAKASSPIFSVGLSKLLYNKAPSMYIVLSLIPITVGVTLSALTELNFALFGFIAAVMASVAAVLNSIYGKQALHHISCPDPIIFHFYTSVCAVLMVLPWVVYNDMSSIYRSVHTTSIISVDGISSLVTQSIPYKLIMMSLAMHYLQNISSIYYLAGVTVLTHQVASTMKRLMVIASTVVYFGNPVGVMNAVGMGIAVCGYFCYGLAKQYAADLHQEVYQHENASAHTSPHHHAHSGRRLSTDVELEPIMVKRSVSSTSPNTPMRSPPASSRMTNRLLSSDNNGAMSSALHAMMNGNSQHTHHSSLPHRSPQPSLPASANLGTHARRHSNTPTSASRVPSPTTELEHNEVRLDIGAPNDKAQMNGHTSASSSTNGSTQFQPPTTAFDTIREVSSGNDLAYFHRTDSEGNLPYFLEKHTPNIYDSRSTSPVPAALHSQTLPLTKANMMRHEQPRSYDKLRRNDRSETALSEASTVSTCSNDSMGLV